MKHRIRIRRKDGIRQRYWVGRTIRKNYGSKVVETPEMRGLRERRGFDEIIEIDAKSFAERFKKDQGQDIAWSQERLKSAREREVVDSYPQVTVSENTGRIDVNDGRHRLAVAAEKGEKIKVAIRSGQENKLLTALRPRPVITFDEPTDGTRHVNNSERVARRQAISNELMERGWGLVSAAQTAFDIEEKEEKERKIKVDKLDIEKSKNFGSFGEENDDDIVINLGRKVAEKHRRQLSGLKDIAQDVDRKMTPVTGFLITETGIKRLAVYPKDKPKIAEELFRKAEDKLITKELQEELAKKIYNKDTFFMLDRNKKSRINRLIKKNIETKV